MASGGEHVRYHFRKDQGRGLIVQDLSGQLSGSVLYLKREEAMEQGREDERKGHKRLVLYSAKISCLPHWEQLAVGK